MLPVIKIKKKIRLLHRKFTINIECYVFITTDDCYDLKTKTNIHNQPQLENKTKQKKKKQMEKRNQNKEKCMFLLVIYGDRSM